MSFPINTTIPAANNNPSNDQPIMQQNFANISGFLSVDHQDPGSSPITGTAGQHKQVNFSVNQSAPALASGAVSGLYSNSTTGIFGTLATLFFQNATKNLPLTNLPIVIAGDNKGVLTPWGLILNFGVGVVGPSGGDVTWAIPMTNAQYALLTSALSTNASVNSTGRFKSGSESTKGTLYASAGGTTVYYLAIGT